MRDLSRFAWLSVAAAIVTIVMKFSGYLVTGSVGLLSDAAAVVTSPGWRPDTPLLVDAADAGVPVVGDVAVGESGKCARSGVLADPWWLLALKYALEPDVDVEIGRVFAGGAGNG